MANENPAKPFYSVLVLAFVCSTLVAGAAVGLRPLQEANRLMDQKKHILYAAGLFEEGKDVTELFASVSTRIVDLKTGEFVGEDVVDASSYNQVKAAFTEDKGQALAGDQDIAKLSRLEKYSFVYLVQRGEVMEQIVLPVRGKGLWSTMYAYVALDADMSTIRGVSFYEHGETPGLGGEIENSKWQAEWQDKRIYSGAGDVAVNFAKGKASSNTKEAQHQIDGLSGATLTTKGVANLMEFWFGDHGFKPFITNMTQRVKSNG